MNIFNHLIPNDAVLGIGPLMLDFQQDGISYMMNGTCRYFFDLHLAAHTTKIYSDWFMPKTDTGDKAKMKAWRDEYYVIRMKIAAMMNEAPEPSIQEEEK